MKAKLTLSLPEAVIHDAKRIAEDRGTTVSALFQHSVEQWRQPDPADIRPLRQGRPELAHLLGAFSPRPAFDARSERIRRKHG